LSAVIDNRVDRRPEGGGPFGRITLIKCSKFPGSRGSSLTRDRAWGPAVRKISTAGGVCKLLAVVLALAAGWPASAQPADREEAAIRAALSKWTSEFNARDPSHICDLFAQDLIYDFRGFPERNYETLCTLLRQSLADRTKAFAYALDIKEIIVSGDIAIVRLVWTLKVTLPGAKEVESEEPGLDVFRKQADGNWKIARYIAYEAP
jgi:steroid delta-isomerase